MVVPGCNDFILPTADSAEPATEPEFLRALSNTSATEGQRLVLEAEVAAEPEPTVTWLKDGRELKPSESMKVG